MLPVLLRIIAVSLGAWAVKELFSDSKIDYTKSHNVHFHFLQFEKNISVPSFKVQKLVNSRKALEKKIVSFFRLKRNVPIPKFYIQGSYKMGTMIMEKDGTYDVDLGVYFLIKPGIEPMTLQKWVLDSINDHTYMGGRHKEKCVRVTYQAEFDIDLPVYYKVQDQPHPFLATKYEWVESDPKELCDWFDAKKDENGQLVRLVKYFKTWAKNRPQKMPSGIAFSVWVAKYFKPNMRDDVAFYETAEAINNSFTWSVSCINPATPEDDLVEKLSSDQKDVFKEEFGNLIESSKKALQQTNLKKTINAWRHLFGNRFSDLLVIEDFKNDR
jgi:Second Messenger Oligonucleotide or Dinucleotide Synthetase domain